MLNKKVMAGFIIGAFVAVIFNMTSLGDAPGLWGWLVAPLVFGVIFGSVVGMVVKLLR
jgi:hypothetical protein